MIKIKINETRLHRTLPFKTFESYFSSDTRSPHSTILLKSAWFHKSSIGAACKIVKVVFKNQNGITNTLSFYFPSQFYFCLINKRKSFRGTQRRFPPTYALKTLFRLSRVLLYLQKCILSSSKKFVSVRSSQDKFNLFEITSEGFSIILPKILDVIQSFAKVRIFFSLLFPSHFRIRKFQVSFFYEN